MPDQNSALIWLPAVQALDFPSPRTEVVKFDPRDLYPLLDGKEPTNFPLAECQQACARIGFPVFVRTDLASAKHDGPAAYKIESPEDVLRCIGRTFEDNCCKFMEFGLEAFLFRQFIEVEAAFTAFHGHPITQEWRIFADQEGAQCSHFYWPKEAFRNQRLPSGWEELLASLSQPPLELATLEGVAAKVVRSLGFGAWSVDFLNDAHGAWCLIDMARAESSWHPEHDMQ